MRGRAFSSVLLFNNKMFQILSYFKQTTHSRSRTPTKSIKSEQRPIPPNYQVSSSPTNHLIVKTQHRFQAVKALTMYTFRGAWYYRCANKSSNTLRATILAFLASILGDVRCNSTKMSVENTATQDEISLTVR